MLRLDVVDARGVQVGVRFRLQRRSGAGPDDGGTQRHGGVILWNKPDIFKGLLSGSELKSNFVL